MDSLIYLLLVFILYVLIGFLAVYDTYKENEEIEEKAKLIMDVKDSVIHESFCQDFCIYDCDNCNEDCLEGIKKGLKGK